MIRLLAFVIALVVAAPAAAAPIFPPLVQGQYAFKVRAAAVELDPGGVPLTTPTASVSIRRTDDGSGVDLTCVPCGPGETVDVLVAVVATGSRGELRGYAFAGPGCTGEAAESENAAFLFFVPPAAPALELSGPSALLPVRARPPDQLARLELSVEGVAFGP